MKPVAKHVAGAAGNNAAPAAVSTYRNPRMPDSLPHPDLVRGAAAPARRYARVLTGDLNRADDLVQDTLARAWEKRRLWRAGSDLASLAVHDHAQRSRQPVCHPPPRAVESSLDADNGPVAGWEIPVRATQSDRVELAEVFAQMGRLPVEQREVLHCWLRSRSCATRRSRACSAYPIGTVMSRLNRAREKLRRMCEVSPSPLKVIK